MRSPFFQGISIPEGFPLAVRELVPYLIQYPEGFGTLDPALLQQFYQLLLAMLERELGENIELTQELLEQTYQLLLRLIQERQMPIPTRASITRVFSKYWTTFLIDGNGNVKGFGENTYHQLGIPTSENPRLPVDLPIKNVIQIAPGGEHTLFLTVDGKVWVVGDNSLGQLGIGENPTSVDTPIINQYLSDVVQIEACELCSFALTAYGELYGFGYNGYGSIGIGESVDIAYTPQLIMKNVRKVCAGYEHVLALTTDGTVWAWGGNRDGQLGFGDENTYRVYTPTRVTAIPSAMDIEANHFVSFAVTSNGTLYGWGKTNAFAYATSNFEEYTPIRLTGIPNSPHIPIVKVKAGYDHGLILAANGWVYGFGSSWAGQVGNRTFDDEIPPTPIMDGVIDITTGDNFSLAVRIDGSVWYWGWNSMLGDWDTNAFPSPIRIL